MTYNRKEDEMSEKPQRVKDWDEFAAYMSSYINDNTVKKYGVGKKKIDVDLISLTEDWKILVWNVLRYALRLWNDRGKRHDLEKIAHYAQMAWKMKQEQAIEDGEVADVKA
jgi:hypothetical protein